MRKHSPKKRQAGVALVEFAITIPLLLLLVVGVSEFGFSFYRLNILNKSVHDGARFFSDVSQARNDVLSNDIDVSADNIAATQNVVIYGNTSATGSPLLPGADNYTVTVNTLTLSGTTEHIIVTAVYNHDFILGQLLNALTLGAAPASYDLTASSVLRVE